MAASDPESAEPLRRWRDSSWSYGGPDAVPPVDADERHRPPPDLFDRLRAEQWGIVRLILEGAAVVVGVLLFVGVGWYAPLLGAGMVAVGLIAGIVELVLLRRLRRGTAEAWVDLSLPPDGRD